MDKKTLTLAIGALSIGLSGAAQADNPFETSSMTKAYNLKKAPIRLAEQVCGAKDKDGACNAASLKSNAGCDADCQEYKAFKASKYFEQYKNSPAYKAFQADEKANTTKTTPKSKSSSCSAGGCGG